MINSSKHLLLVIAASAVFTSCTPPAGNAPNGNVNANANSNIAAKPSAAAPTADALLALDKQANEAYFKGDAQFFEGFLSEKFVTRDGAARLNKTEALKMIGGIKCEVKDGWALSEPRMAKIDNDTYVLNYRSNVEGSCTADGKTEELQGPVRASTVLLRNGEKWQAVFHAENLIVDPAAPPAADKKQEPKKDERSAPNANAAATQTPAASASDPLTDALMAAERSVWDAWKNKDGKKIEELTASEITFVNLFGTYFANKAECIKDWTGPLCDVTSVTLTDGTASEISPTVGILTVTGTVTGKCGGKDISGQKIFANTVYVKDGNAWKWVFGFNSPS